MALNYRRLLTGIQLVPQNTAPPTLPGEIRYNSLTNQFEFFNGTSLDSIISATGPATFSNKTFLDTTTFFANTSDQTKKLQLDVSGISTGTTRTLIVPNTNDTLALVNFAQTLFNKTLNAPIIANYEDYTELAAPGSPASGFLRIYAKTDNQLYSKNSLGVETPFASGGSTFQNGVYNPPKSLANNTIDNLEGMIANFIIDTPHTWLVAPVVDGFLAVIDTLTVLGTLSIQHHGIVKVV